MKSFKSKETKFGAVFWNTALLIFILILRTVLVDSFFVRPDLKSVSIINAASFDILFLIFAIFIFPKSRNFNYKNIPAAIIAFILAISPWILFFLKPDLEVLSKNKILRDILLTISLEGTFIVASSITLLFSLGSYNKSGSFIKFLLAIFIFFSAYYINFKYHEMVFEGIDINKAKDTRLMALSFSGLIFGAVLNFSNLKSVKFKFSLAPFIAAAFLIFLAISLQSDIVLKFAKFLSRFKFVGKSLYLNDVITVLGSILAGAYLVFSFFSPNE